MSDLPASHGGRPGVCHLDNPYLREHGLGIGGHGLLAAANVTSWLMSTVTAPIRYIRRVQRGGANGGDLGVRDFGSDSDPGRFELRYLSRRVLPVVGFNNLVLGLPTDVLCVGDPKGAAAILVLIPGNPGNAGFYRSYMAQLVKRSGGRLACMAISHLGHSTRAPPMPGQRFSYRSQITHMARALKWVQADHPDQRFIIAGHSIGARIIFELQQSHPACFDWDRVLRYLLLFPTLGHLGASKAGHNMHRVLTIFPTAAANVVTALTSVLPTGGLRLLTKLGRGTVSRQAQDGMLQIVDGAVIANCFHMALGEMQEVLNIPKIAPDVQEKMIICEIAQGRHPSPGSPGRPPTRLAPCAPRPLEISGWPWRRCYR